MNFFDKYIVKECYVFRNNILDHYDSFKYNHISQTVNYFVSNIVSGLYCHCIKDRLYCSLKNSNERISSQLVMHTILVILCEALGPILPHLVEEAWKYHPLYENPFYFTRNIPLLPECSVEDAMMDLVLDIKKEINNKTKNENLRKFIVNIKTNNDLFNKLIVLNEKENVCDSVLCEILEVSSVNLEVTNGGKWDVDIIETELKQCLRCRKYNVKDGGDKCDRCTFVLGN